MNDKETSLSNEKKIERAAGLVKDIYGAKVAQLLSDKLQQSPNKVENFCILIEEEHKDHFNKVILSIESGNIPLNWDLSKKLLVGDMRMPVIGKINDEIRKRFNRLAKNSSNLILICDKKGPGILNSVSFLPSYFRGKEAKDFLLSNNNYRDFLNILKATFGKKADEAISEIISAIETNIDMYEENDSILKRYPTLMINVFIPSAKKYFAANSKINDAISDGLPKAALADEYEIRQTSWTNMKMVMDQLKDHFGLSENLDIGVLTDEIVLLPEDLAEDKLKKINIKIKDIMKVRFNLAELNELCMDLGIEPEELPETSTRTSFSISIIKKMTVENKFIKLVSKIIESRPELEEELGDYINNA